MSADKNILDFRLQPTQRVSLGLWQVTVLIWILILIGTPIAGWAFGPRSFPLMATAGVIAQAGATIVILNHAWHLSRVIRLIIIVIPVTWMVEVVGVRTGFPFGHYHYTSALWPQVGNVPLLIPLAWLMMLPASWSVADAIIPERQSQVFYAGLSGLIFTAWDLYLDPQMTSHNLWQWHEAGGYFGIPWTNYIGWWLISSVITWLVRPCDLPRRPLLLIYTLVWIFQVVALSIFWGQPGPALVGFVGMGVPTAFAWAKEQRA